MDMEIQQQRKIIHIDMDAFYAAVEQRDHPELKGKPLVVGGMPDRRGVVATASYEARKFGIRSAMSCIKAQQLCPEVLFVYPRFDAYKAVSAHIREIFNRYTDLVEPLSLDEAFLDVTHDKLNIGSALEIARQIKQAIKDELQLTASAGVSVNKFVAKIASDMNKPDGITFIGPSKIIEFLESLPVEKFYGVGKVTAEKMRSMHLYIGADLKRLSEAEMLQHFGKAGRFYFQMLRGIDNRPVQAQRAVKSVGAEDTFEHDLEHITDMNLELEKIVEKVLKRLDKNQLKGRTITLKVKFHNFKQITRNQSLLHPTSDRNLILSTAQALLTNVDRAGLKVRLLGISLSNFTMPLPTGSKKRNPQQLEIFDERHDKIG